MIANINASQPGAYQVTGPQVEPPKAGTNGATAGAGKRSPGGAGSIGEIAQPDTTTNPVGGEVPRIGNKKRVEYINQLKDDLDNKLRQRYAYTNLQQKNTTLSQSNNLILIDHNSAYNPSNMGDNEDASPTENRVHNYVFGRQIGEGAYAVVRIATSREDNKKYAIKVYDKTKLSDINR